MSALKGLSESAKDTLKAIQELIGKSESVKYPLLSAGRKKGFLAGLGSKEKLSRRISRKASKKSHLHEDISVVQPKVKLEAKPHYYTSITRAYERFMLNSDIMKIGATICILIMILWSFTSNPTKQNQIQSEMNHFDSLLRYTLNFNINLEYKIRRFL